MTDPFPLGRHRKQSEVAEVREQLAIVLAGLDKLSLFQAGAHVSMALECLDRKLIEIGRCAPDRPSSALKLRRQA